MIPCPWYHADRRRCDHATLSLDHHLCLSLSNLFPPSPLERNSPPLLLTEPINCAPKPQILLLLLQRRERCASSAALAFPLYLARVNLVSVRPSVRCFLPSARLVFRGGLTAGEEPYPHLSGPGNVLGKTCGISCP